MQELQKAVVSQRPILESSFFPGRLFTLHYITFSVIPILLLHAEMQYKHEGNSQI